MSHPPPPLQGIDYLVSSGLLRSDPGEVAAFLKAGGALPDGRECGEPLNRRAVGEYLGALGGRDEEAREFQRAMLRAYAFRFPFAGRTFTQALRLFLAEFRLPGEAQMIDRLMAAFAEAFSRENAGTFATSDAAYLLAFACIMLNTDLHKGGAKHKMTAEQFVGNLRGAAPSAPPAPLLAEVYADIAAAPLALDADASFLTFFAPIKQGWLLKRCTGPLPRWKRRFFLLADGVLYYFSSETDVAAGKPRLILPLDGTALQLVGSLGLRIVPRGAVGGGGGGGGGGSSGGEGGSSGEVQQQQQQQQPLPAAGAVVRRGSAGHPPAKLMVGIATVTCSPTGAVRFPGQLHSPRSSDDGGAGSDAPPRRMAALTLKTAKRTDDGTVRRGRYGDFELRAESARERDEWAGAISSARGAPRRDGSRLKEVTGQRGAGALPVVGGVVVGGGGGGGSGSADAPAVGGAGAAPLSAAAAAAAAIAAAAATSEGVTSAGGASWKPQGSSQRHVSFSRPRDAGGGGAVTPSAPLTPRKSPSTPVLAPRASASRENLLAVVSRFKSGAEAGEDLNSSGAGGEVSGEEASSDEDAVEDDTAFKEEAVVTLRVVAQPPARGGEAVEPAPANAAPSAIVGSRPREGSSWGLLETEAEDVWRTSPSPQQR
jgi:hypothetical protein